MSKNLLHKTQVDDFLNWCRTKGLQVREGRGDYQVAQILPIGSNNWKCIYRREHMPEHVTVDMHLDLLVRNYLRQAKGAVLVKYNGSTDTASFTPVEPDHD